jgi:hypothetical protein
MDAVSMTASNGRDRTGHATAALAIVVASISALPTGAQAARACGQVTTARYRGAAVRVTVYEGNVPCREARRVASKFQSPDRGHFYGQNLANGYWLVYGWKCQAGTGGGSGCTHGPGSTITMQAEPEQTCGNSTVASTVVNGSVASGWDEFHVNGTSCQVALRVMRRFEAEHLSVRDQVEGWKLAISHFKLAATKGTATFYCYAFGVD